MQAWARVVEAHHSTRLAGMRLTLDQSERILAGQIPEDASEHDVRVLVACHEELGRLRQPGYGGAVNDADRIRELRERLVGANRTAQAAGGRDDGYRTAAGDITDPRTGRTLFTPPPPREIPRRMAELVEWLGQDHGTDEVLSAGIAQVLMLQIRPFDDANGRTARLVSLHCLRSSGYDVKGLYSLSEPYDRDPAVYVRAVRSARDRQGDLTVWLEYFAEMLAGQMRDVQDRAEKVIRRDAIARMHPLSQRQRAALAHALVQGGLTVEDFQILCPGVSRATLLKDLRGMIDRGLLTMEATSERRIYRISNAAI